MRTTSTTPIGRALGLALAVWAFCLPVAAGTVVYVDADALGGADDGTSWDDAYLDLKDALLLAPAGLEIRVAEGTYRPDQGSGLRSATFGILASLTLRGGYAGVGAPDPDARDPELTPTVLSGDLHGDDLPGFVNRGDNAYHVVTVSAGQPLIDGVTIRGGQADGAGWPDGLGAGLLDFGEATLCDSLITDNFARDEGGGVRGGGTFEDCRFLANRTEGQGGGGYLIGDGVLRDCVFEANVSSGLLLGAGGGGAYLDGGSDMAVEDCRFVENICQAAGRGGGLAVEGSEDRQVLRCDFIANVVEGDGEGGGAWDVDFDGSSTRFEDCRFLGNSVEGAAGRGGGAAGGEEDGGMLLVSCLVLGNHAGGTGGGVLLAEVGGVTRCTVVANTCGDATGAGVAGVGAWGIGVSSSIVYGNRAAGLGGEAAQLAITGPNPVNVDYSDIEGLTGALGGQGNIDADPLFVDADGADDAAGTEDDDVSLSPGSPCIDAGNPLLPLDPDGTVIEMGALFFDQGPPPPGPWTDLGLGLAGTLGEPVLTGTGTIAANQQGGLDLTNALPFQLTFLVLGITRIDAPFKGGTLVPDADFLVVQVTDGGGAASLAGTWPASVVPGLSFWAQAWMADPGGPLGHAASNALEGLSQ